MRTDRPLSLLILLQTREQMTAEGLAHELEVSAATIYRGIDALSSASVPVHDAPGPGGGYAMIESCRTNLTGPSEGEVHALFLFCIPALLVDVGVSQELKAALFRLSAALTNAHRCDERRMLQRHHLDSAWRHQGEEPGPHLLTIHRAASQGRKLSLAYHIYHSS